MLEQELMRSALRIICIWFFSYRQGYGDITPRLNSRLISS